MKLSLEGMELLLGLSLESFRLNQGEEGGCKLVVFPGSKYEAGFEFSLEVPDQLIVQKYNADSLFYEAVQKGLIKKDIQNEITAFKRKQLIFKGVMDLLAHFINVEEWAIEALDNELPGELSYQADEECAVYSYEEFCENIVLPYKNKTEDISFPEYDEIFIELTKTWSQEDYSIQTAIEETNGILKGFDILKEKWNKTLVGVNNSKLKYALTFTEGISYAQDEESLQIWVSNEIFEWQLTSYDIEDETDMLALLENLKDWKISEYILEEFIFESGLDLSVEECQKLLRKDFERNYAKIKPILELVKQSA